MTVEKQIVDLSVEFSKELQKLVTRLDWPKWTTTKLFLEVSYSQEAGPDFELRWYNPNGDDVRAKSLGALMDEVYHRQDFDDRQKAIQPLAALTGPKETSDDEKR
jgi:hypothetical protein